MATSKKTGFDFVGKAPILGGFSVFFVIASLVFLAVRGITYGIDFAGGTEMQVKFQQQVTIEQMRTLTEQLKLPGSSVQGFGDGQEFLIRFQTDDKGTEKETNERQNVMVASLKSAIDTQMGTLGPEYRRIDSVGPQVGAELKRNSMLAIFYCLLVILIYVSLRFDYKYAPGAVICLFHDAVITLAIFVAVGKEVNIPVLAAILTLIGYSLNDTIVVFDRIRETESTSRTASTGDVINTSINDMFSRTIITTGTTLVSAVCLYIFADGVVSDIAFAITIGIVFGSYSSIFVAAPLILVTEKFKIATGAKA
jgi:preprotein translocase subunit SecF